MVWRWPQVKLGDLVGHVEIKVPVAYPRENPVGQCYLEIIRNAGSWGLFRPTESVTLMVKLRNLFLNKPSRWFWCILKFFNLCCRSLDIWFCNVGERSEPMMGVESMKVSWKRKSRSCNKMKCWGTFSVKGLNKVMTASETKKVLV